MIDLAFMLAEVGHEKFYRPLASQMIESAKACMTARFVQFADRVSDPLPGVSVVVREDVEKDNLMMMRSKLLRDYVRHSSGHIVMCDADVTWQRDPEPLFDGSFDIGVAWRADQEAMPYCGGLLMIRHGSEAAQRFLNEWWFMQVTMPPVLKKWWGDQVALAVMIGRGVPGEVKNVNGCRVRIFDCGDTLFQISDEHQTAPASALCRHYKGKVKGKMIAEGRL